MGEFRQRRVLRDSGLFDLLKTDDHRAGQTYFQWKLLRLWQGVLHPRRQRRRVLCLQPLGDLRITAESTGENASGQVVDRLKEVLEAFFLGMTVEVLPPLMFHELRCEKRIHTRTNRVQWLVSDLLLHLERTRPRRAFCIVGITVEDLYPSEEWNFVLGHALWRTGCAVISMGRYASDTPTEEVTIMEIETLMWRLARVVTHETCHLFGMGHCCRFVCAMNESSSVSEAESQPLVLCPSCLKKLQKALRFQLQERYTNLAVLCHQISCDKGNICMVSGISDFSSKTLRVVEHQTKTKAVSQGSLKLVKPSPMGGVWLERKFTLACQWLDAAVASLRD